MYQLMCKNKFLIAKKLLYNSNIKYSVYITMYKLILNEIFVENAFVWMTTEKMIVANFFKKITLNFISENKLEISSNKWIVEFQICAKDFDIYEICNKKIFSEKLMFIFLIEQNKVNNPHNRIIFIKIFDENNKLLYSFDSTNLDVWFEENSKNFFLKNIYSYFLFKNFNKYVDSSNENIYCFYDFESKTFKYNTKRKIIIKEEIKNIEINGSKWYYTEKDKKKNYCCITFQDFINFDITKNMIFFIQKLKIFNDENNEILKKILNANPNLSETLSLVYKDEKLKHAKDELKKILENDESNENDVQLWFSKYSEILVNFSDKHRKILKSFQNQNSINKYKIIDLYASEKMTPFINIIELKSPKIEIFKNDNSRNEFYFSSEVSKAISQVDTYLEILMDNELSENRKINESKNYVSDTNKIIDKNFSSNQNRFIYRPKAIIFVGKKDKDWDSNGYAKEKKLRSLNDKLQRIEIYTYNHLLDFLD